MNEQAKNIFNAASASNWQKTLQGTLRGFNFDPYGGLKRDFSNTANTPLMPMPVTQVAEQATGSSSSLGSSVPRPVSNAFGGVSYDQWGNIASGLSTFLPQKTEYSGANGEVTAGMDSVYDSASEAVKMIPGIGPVASLGMKAGKLVGNVANALGAGTDGMTTTDAILGSSFLNLTPIGLINGIGGKRADTLVHGDNEKEAIAKVGNAYGGSMSDYRRAFDTSGKKYGLFSGGARRRANQRMAEAENMMNQMQMVSDTASLRSELGNAMGDQFNMAYQMQLQGGYRPTTMIGRNGLRFPAVADIEYVREMLKDLKHKKMLEEVALGEPEEEFLSYQIVDDDLASPVESEIILIDEKPVVGKFMAGGKMSLIPEGALHGRNHNMEDADGLTQKGIPVVDNKGNQTAEVERDEIIFRKEITSAIEEALEDPTDEKALEIGKLVAKEIFENTDDRTGLIKKLTGEDVGDFFVPKKYQFGGTIDPMLFGKTFDADAFNQKMKSQLESNILDSASLMKQQLPGIAERNQNYLNGLNSPSTTMNDYISSGVNAVQSGLGALSNQKRQNELDALQSNAEFDKNIGSQDLAGTFAFGNGGEFDIKAIDLMRKHKNLSFIKNMAKGSKISYKKEELPGGKISLIVYGGNGDDAYAKALESNDYFIAPHDDENFIQWFTGEGFEKFAQGESEKENLSPKEKKILLDLLMKKYEVE